VLVDASTFESLAPLPDTEVRNLHDALDQSLHDLAHKYFKDTGADPSGEPEWCQIPGEELKSLYHALLGRHRESYANELSQLEKIKAVDIPKQVLEG